MKRLYPNLASGFLLLFFLLLTSESMGQWLPGYQYRKQLTIADADITGGVHSEFPVLLYLTSDANLSARAQADGFDIAFTDTDGETQLSHELDTYITGTGELRVWIKMDLPATGDKVFYMYYDAINVIGSDPSTTDTWNSNYSAVWHLEENPNGDPSNGILDATGNNNDGTPSGTLTGANQVAGQIGNAIDLDGADDFIGFPNSSSLNITGNTLTVEAWVNVDSPNSQDVPFVVHGDFDNQERYMLGTDGGNEDVNVRITTSSGHFRYDDSPFPDNTWTHVAMVYNGGLGLNPRLFSYKNGALVASNNADGNILSSAGGVNLGRRLSSNRFLNGIIDEIRISDVVRSTDWFATQFDNHDDPTTGAGGFFTLGAEDATCATLPTMSATATAGSICSGDLADISTADISGTSTFDWSVVYSTGVAGPNGSGTDVAITTSVQETLTYSGTSSGTATYTFIPESAAGCKGDPIDVVVSVYPVAANKTVTPASATICESTTVDITVQTSESGVIYQLRNNGDNSALSANYLGDGGNLVLTSNTLPLALDPLTIKVTATYPSAVNCEIDLSTTIPITFNIAPTIGVQPTDPAAICEGAGNLVMSVTASGTSLSYQWEESTNGGMSYSNVVML
jgi:hypothetical protein